MIPHQALIIVTRPEKTDFFCEIVKWIDGRGANPAQVCYHFPCSSWGFCIPFLYRIYLRRYGAYGRDEIYTLDDIHEVVQYGLLHGVRIIMEIDAPSHAGYGWQWGPKYGLGDLAVCVNKQPWKRLDTTRTSNFKSNTLEPTFYNPVF